MVVADQDFVKPQGEPLPPEHLTPAGLAAFFADVVSFRRSHHRLSVLGAQDELRAFQTAIGDAEMDGGPVPPEIDLPLSAFRG